VVVLEECTLDDLPGSLVLVQPNNVVSFVHDFLSHLIELSFLLFGLGFVHLLVFLEIVVEDPLSLEKVLEIGVVEHVEEAYDDHDELSGTTDLTHGTQKFRVFSDDCQGFTTGSEGYDIVRWAVGGVYVSRDTVILVKSLATE